MGRSPRAVGRLLYCSLQLPTGCINIPASGPADEGGNTGLSQNPLELQHTFLIRAGEIDAETRIEGYQIHFAADTANQFDDFTRVGGLVIHPAEENVFEGDALSIAQRKLTRGLHKDR